MAENEAQINFEEAPPADEAGRPGVTMGPSGSERLGKIPVPERFDERAHLARQYKHARQRLMEAMRLLEIYEDAGIKPCDLGSIHPIIRSSFGY